MLRFDEPKLLAGLRALDVSSRVAFAAACAERLRAYFGYPNSPPAPAELDAALGILSRSIRAGVHDAAVQAAVRVCEASFDKDDDAIAAVIFASRARGADGVQAAAWAARRGYEARDRLVSDGLDVDFSAEDSEQLVLRHPIVQAELQRQARDLELLSASPDQASSVLQGARKAGEVRDAV